MSRKYKVLDQNDLQFLTYAVVGWVDALSRPHYKDIIVESLAHCQRDKGLQLFAWVIMSNHVHLIARAAPGGKLENIMRDHKKFTSKAFVEAIDINGKESRKEWMLPLLRKSDGAIHFWQHDIHRIWVRSPDVIRTKLNYIHMNPVKEGYVDEPRDYRYSSAKAYAGMPTMRSIAALRRLPNRLSMGSGMERATIRNGAKSERLPEADALSRVDQGTLCQTI